MSGECRRPVSLLNVRYDSPYDHPPIPGNPLGYRCDECDGCLEYYDSLLVRLVDGVRLTHEERAATISILHQFRIKRFLARKEIP